MVQGGLQYLIADAEYAAQPVGGRIDQSESGAKAKTARVPIRPVRSCARHERVFEP